MGMQLLISPQPFCIPSNKKINDTKYCLISCIWILRRIIFDQVDTGTNPYISPIYS